MATRRMGDLLRQRYGAVSKHHTVDLEHEWQPSMSVTPMAFADSLRIGSIDYISPDALEVLSTSRRLTLSR